MLLLPSILRLYPLIFPLASLFHPFSFPCFQSFLFISSLFVFPIFSPFLYSHSHSSSRSPSSSYLPSFIPLFFIPLSFIPLSFIPLSFIPISSFLSRILHSPSHHITSSYFSPSVSLPFSLSTSSTDPSPSDLSPFSHPIHPSTLSCYPFLWHRLPILPSFLLIISSTYFHLPFSLSFSSHLSSSSCTDLSPPCFSPRSPSLSPHILSLNVSSMPFLPLSSISITNSYFCLLFPFHSLLHFLLASPRPLLTSPLSIFLSFTLRPSFDFILLSFPAAPFPYPPFHPISLAHIFTFLFLPISSSVSLFLYSHLSYTPLP